MKDQDGRESETLLTKGLLGCGLHLPTYRMGSPRLRFGARFVSLRSWIFAALGVVVLVVVAAQLVRATPTWQAFSADHACVIQGTPAMGFPAWLRAMHWLNVLVVLVMLRSGLQILADHPRLYWTMHCTPQSEWVRFRGSVPVGEVWTALDDSTHLSPWLGLPGGRHTSGMARHWHFLTVPIWLMLGVAFVVLLVATGQWQQIVPVSGEIVPRALSCAVDYASLNLPSGEGDSATYNALQLLTYFVVVFLLPPLQVLTGLAQSPGFAHHYAWLPRVFGNRQIARSLHFMGWLFFAAFLVVHVVLVASTGFFENMNHMVLGTLDDQSPWGAALGAGLVAVIAVALWAQHRLSWSAPRRIQHAFQRCAVVVRRRVFERIAPRVHWPESAISPYFWPNGRPPRSSEFEGLREGGFRDYRLRVFGDVAQPRDFTLEELKSLGKHEQITEHDCVQGWSGIAKWGGAPMAAVLDAVRPNEGSKYAVFTAFPEVDGAEPFYDVHDLALLRNPDSILAYEMNGRELPLLHGRPLRLRNESELGFKQVKWIRSIEITREYASKFAGEGGTREDHELIGRCAEI